MQIVDESLKMVDSASDDRTANNAMRHQYRVLSDAEKQAMVDFKDYGATFLNAVAELEKANDISPERLAARRRAYAIGKTKMEEAVMWVVKGMTG